MTDADLDTRVATAVMGWELRRLPWAYDDTAQVWHDADGLPGITRHGWSPSRDAAQCETVVRAMIARGWSLTLHWGPAGAAAYFTTTADVETPATDACPRRATLQAALAALDTA